LRLQWLRQGGHHFIWPADAGTSDGARSPAAATSDFFLVAGSSLVVYPAAGFSLLANCAGAKLAILNRTPTDQDEYTDLVIWDGIGLIFSGALAEL
jgi:NAD-dependent SIR2 family protein deacetylase